MNIYSASPAFVPFGADDKSGTSPAIPRIAIPQHSPVIYSFFRKGTTKKIPIGGSGLKQMYGSESFEKSSPYYTHQTRFLVGIAGEGNLCNVKRLIPTDAGVKSNIVVYIDLLEDEIPNFVRNSKGEFVIDPETNEYKVDSENPTINGYRIKFISKSLNTDVEFGLLTSEQGSMSKEDKDGNIVKSTMYPLFEIKAKYQGEYYNNIGFGISSLFKDKVDTAIIEETLSLPYELSLYERNNKNSSPTIKRTLFGAPSATISLKNDAINPTTDGTLDFETIFKDQWFNETDNNKSLIYNDFEGVYVYRENLKYVNQKILKKEADYITYEDKKWDDDEISNTMEWFDFVSDTNEDIINDQYLLLNIFAGKSTKNVNYFTLVHDKGTVDSEIGKEVTFSINTPIMLEGGSDGTMSDEMFEKLVIAEVSKYADENSEVMDTAINVENFLYDSGFSLPTKKELISFIALRKDTILILSTHIASLKEKVLPLANQRAIAVSLRTALRLAPESDFFGTGVARSVIMAGTGLMRDGSTTDRIPLTYELAIKAAKMMGAGNYKWKINKKFDSAPGNVLTELIDIQPAFIPAGIKPVLWNDGIVWAQPYNLSEFHFPGLQTVYSDSTSVLNSFTTIVALSTATRIANDAWREFTGNTSLTNPEFVEAVNAYLTKRFNGIFGGLVTIVPETRITEEDEVRGYSWEVVNKLYANNGKTKMFYVTEVYRSSDLQ